MGKFTDTKVSNTINNITDGYKSRLENPTYTQQERSKIVVTYYAINRAASHMDESTGLVEDNYGLESPLRYNKIENFIMYTDNILLTTTINETDFGPEGDPFHGTCSILPRTVSPNVGDCFKIPHVKEDLLFKVIEVQTYLLDSGNTWYEVEWTLVESGEDYTDRIETNVVDDYEFIINNTGTELNPLIQSKTYALAKELDNTNEILRNYYLELFFNNSVQGLIYRNDDGVGIYDEMLTEFASSTGILSDHRKFVYLHPLIPKSYQFSFKYRMTIFGCIIEKNLQRIKNKKIINGVWADTITRPDTVFYTRAESYMDTQYDLNSKTSIPSTALIIPFDNLLLDGIVNNELLEDDILSNIIIRYMNNEKVEFTDEDLELLKDIYMNNTTKLFYYLPCIIYIIDKEIKLLMAKEE